MNIKRKLQRLWQRLFLKSYLYNRIADERFLVLLFLEEEGLLGKHLTLSEQEQLVKEVAQCRRNMRRLGAFMDRTLSKAGG